MVAQWILRSIYEDVLFDRVTMKVEKELESIPVLLFKLVN